MFHTTLKMPYFRNITFSYTLYHGTGFFLKFCKQWTTLKGVNLSFMHKFLCPIRSCNFSVVMKNYCLRCRKCDIIGLSQNIISGVSNAINFVSFNSFVPLRNSMLGFTREIIDETLATTSSTKLECLMVIRVNGRNNYFIFGNYHEERKCKVNCKRLPDWSCQV